MFREKVLNLNPPSYHNDGSFILAIDYIYSYPAIPIYFSPFIKNTNGKFGVPSSLHLEVGLSSGVFPLSEQLNAVRNAPISDLLRKNIHNQDSTRILLFGEQFSNTEDINLILENLWEEKLVKQIFLAVRNEDADSPDWLYIEIKQNQMLPAGRISYKEWVNQGMHFENLQPMITEILEDDGGEEIEIILDFRID